MAISDGHLGVEVSGSVDSTGLTHHGDIKMDGIWTPATGEDMGAIDYTGCTGPWHAVTNQFTGGPYILNSGVLCKIDTSLSPVPLVARIVAPVNITDGLTNTLIVGKSCGRGSFGPLGSNTLIGAGPVGRTSAMSDPCIVPAAATSGLL